MLRSHCLFVIVLTVCSRKIVTPLKSELLTREASSDDLESYKNRQEEESTRKDRFWGFFRTENVGFANIIPPPSKIAEGIKPKL